MTKQLKRKINLISPHLRIAGGTKRIVRVANNLVKDGHEVNILCLKNQVEIPDILAKVTQIKEVNNSIPDADFTICYADGPCEQLLDLSDSKGRPVMFYMHYGVHNPDIEAQNMLLPIDRWTTTTWLEEECKKHTFNEVVKIGFGIDHDIFRPMQKNRVAIGALYHNATFKRFNDTMKVFNIIADDKSMSRLQFNILSSKPIDISSWKIRNRTNLFINPKVNEIAEIYNTSLVWLCTSAKEGIGMTSIEAMSCGTALVTSNTLGSNEFAINGQTALVHDVGDVHGMANSIRRIVRDVELKNKLVLNGIEKSNTFSWDQVMKNINDYLGRH